MRAHVVPLRFGVTPYHPGVIHTTPGGRSAAQGPHFISLVRVERARGRGKGRWMKAHFVTFYSPGTFVAESDERPIASWDVDEAMRMADSISQRHGATPFGFRFSTRERDMFDLDSHVSASSPLHFLGGKIETLEEVEARNDPKEETLRSNMRGNGYKRIVTNTNSWKWTMPFGDEDVLLDYTPPCPRCHRRPLRTSATYYRKRLGAVQRTRRCTRCGYTFVTLERFDGAAPVLGEHGAEREI
jgi:hypothetical protein